MNKYAIEAIQRLRNGGQPDLAALVELAVEAAARQGQEAAKPWPFTGAQGALCITQEDEEDARNLADCPSCTNGNLPTGPGSEWGCSDCLGTGKVPA